VRTFWLGVGFCVLIGVAIVGCGGSDDAAISQQNFARQSNAICSKINKEAAGEVKKAFEGPELAGASSEGDGIRGEVTVIVPILIAEAEAQHKGLASVGMPDGQEAAVEAILGAYTTWIKKAKTSPLKIVLANDIYNDARELAGKAGLAKCRQTPFEVIY
jgi:hypothetical protein